MSLKKDGTIRDRHSRVFESYLKIREHKKGIKAKARKIQEDLSNGDCYISDDEEKNKESD